MNCCCYHEHILKVRLVNVRERSLLYSLPYANYDELVCDNDNAYALRIDYDTNEGTVNYLWKFSFSSEIWSQLEVRNMPDNIRSKMYLDKKSLYIRGVSSVNGSYHTHLYLIELTENELICERIDSTDNSIPFLIGENLSIENHHFTICGEVFRNPSIMAVYKTSLKKLDQEIIMKNGTIARTGHKISAAGHKIYVFGGKTLDRLRHLRFHEVPFFDIDENIWGSIKTIKDPIEGYPFRRSEHTVVYVPGENSFFMFGGKSSKSKVLGCAWKLNLQTLSWRKIRSLSLSIPVCSHHTVLTPSGKMYTFGGYTRGNNDNLYCTPHVQTAWLVIPRIFDLAWSIYTRSHSPEECQERLPYGLKMKL